MNSLGGHEFSSTSCWGAPVPVLLERKRNNGRVRARRVHFGPVRRQLELARPYLVSCELSYFESLQKFHHYYGDDFKIECPTGSGRYLTINEVAGELGRRLTRLFTRNEKSRRRVFGQNDWLQSDPHFRDYINFHEYFHGESGRGVGASHQTGWTGLIAKIIQPRVGL